MLAQLETLLLQIGHFLVGDGVNHAEAVVVVVVSGCLVRVILAQNMALVVVVYCYAQRRLFVASLCFPYLFSVGVRFRCMYPLSEVIQHIVSHVSFAAYDTIKCKHRYGTPKGKADEKSISSSKESPRRHIQTTSSPP